MGLRIATSQRLRSLPILSHLFPLPGSRGASTLEGTWKLHEFSCFPTAPTHTGFGRRDLRTNKKEQKTWKFLVCVAAKSKIKLEQY